MQYTADYTRKTLLAALIDVLRGSSQFRSPRVRHGLLSGQYVIPQELYVDGIKPRGPLASLISFNALPVRDAAEGKLDGLYDPAGAAFPADVYYGQKLSVRLLLHGFGEEGSHHRQVNVRKASGTTLTRAELAKRIAKEVKRFMEGNGFRALGKMGIELGKVVLLDVLHVSQGSLKPVIGVLRD
ncbi:hypothetical protein C8Q80DRAFT_1123275 [Daedaleopsis nitida]|nr:hypothetical protein C8Q80DRAFT_1123275 [Daedaleopsis nitida]